MQTDNPLHSIVLERHVLGSLFKYPQLLSDVDGYISESEFCHDFHRVLYSCLKLLINQNKGKKVDSVLVANHIANLNLKTHDDIDPPSYIDIISKTLITEEAAKTAFAELVKLRICRDLCKTADEIKKFVTHNKDKNANEVVFGADQIYNEKVGLSVINDGPINIYLNLKEKVDNVAKNPPDPNKFLFGPFETVNRIYGSLLRPSSINLIGARTAAGKTQLGMFYLNYVAEKYNLPILHLDCCEMTIEDLQMRSVCMLTKGKVSLHHIENGTWVKYPEMVKLIQPIWDRVARTQLFYKDIGHLKPSEIINYIRRFYYKYCGRDFDPQHRKVKLLIHYDYLKPFEFNPLIKEYAEMGNFVHAMKSLLNNEINAALWVSLQTNRLGITNNKNSTQIDQSEGSFGISDRIIQQSTHAWLLRPKLTDEIAAQGTRFGNVVFDCLKKRYLGLEYEKALKPVKIGKGQYRANYINLQNSSFYFEDKGDLNSMMESLSDKHNIQQDNGNKDDGAI